jgi:peptide subunit release factor 1 (eRF1)
VRLGGHAVGVAEGDRLVVSKVGSRPVHGRNAAGGWSQQRFARRRDGQVRVALQAAADTAARVLVPHAASLEAVVLGGDRSAAEAVLEDARLAPLRPLVTGRVLDVPDPRLAVLEQAVPRARAVRVRVVDPPG